jgi:signal transduction histidine kinase
VRWVGASDVDVPNVVAELCFPIAQEAVSNAARHGLAHEVADRALRAVGGLEMIVGDDGTGRTVSEATRGFGIRAMRYRADQMGGLITIGRGPGGGTTVRHHFPLQCACIPAAHLGYSPPRRDEFRWGSRRA